MIADSYLLHPLKGLGYQFFSGIGSSINEWLQTIVVIIVALLAWWHHHNCHVHRCYRLQWHVSEKHGGHPVCKVHHEHHPRGGGHCIIGVHGIRRRHVI